MARAAGQLGERQEKTYREDGIRSGYILSILPANPEDLVQLARVVAACTRQTVEDVLLNWLRLGGSEGLDHGFEH